MEAVRRQWKYPFACTPAVWGKLEKDANAGSRAMDAVLHEMSTLAGIAAQKRKVEGRLSEIRFAMVLVGAFQDLKLHVGPGDQGEPVLTLMLPNED